MNIIRTKNLKKVYGQDNLLVEALRGVDVEISKGEITTILGASGSGKTTLLNLLSGLDTISSGEAYVDGVAVHELSDKKLVEYRKDKIGFIFQSYNLIKDLTVRENVELIAALSSDALDIDEVLGKVGILEHAHKFPYQLSGGQQQRVAIARAIIKNPQILFCDEPTGALDEKVGKEVLELIQELNKEGTTIVMITHNPGIADMSHKVIKVNSGEIVEVTNNKKPVDAKDVTWG